MTCRGEPARGAWFRASTAIVAVVALAAGAYAQAGLVPIPVVPPEVTGDQQRQIQDAAPAKASVAPAQPRRVLIFNTPYMDASPHKGYCIPYGTYAMQVLGLKTGAFEPVVSDDIAMLLPESLKQFDAIVLNNADGAWIRPREEDLPRLAAHGTTADEVERVLRRSLLDFIANGGGLVAYHFAIGANPDWPEYHELLGATYWGHPWNEEVGVRVEEPDNPLTAAFGGERFRVADEIFQFNEPYSREKQRVLLTLDTAATNMNVQWVYRTDGDFALAWVKPYGKGRVFYTALGHRTEIYWNPAMLRFYLDAIQFATGDLAAPTEPRPMARAAEEPAGALRIAALNPTAGRYEMVEFALELPGSYTHPYSPDEVDLRLELMSPDGRSVTVPAFFYQHYDRQRRQRDGAEADWFYPDRVPEWRARFAPDEAGTWTAVAHLKDATGECQSESVQFECTPSGDKGFVGISEADPRFLAFTSGDPFFAVGQNLAFIGPSQYAGLTRAEGILAKMAASGANYARVWTCCEDWAMAIEAPKSAWDRSWARNAPVVAKADAAGNPVGGRCIEVAGEAGKSVSLQPSHPVAVRPGTRYRFSGTLRAEAGTALSLAVGGDTLELAPGPEWAPFSVDWTSGDGQYWLGQPAFRLNSGGKAWLDQLSLTEAAGGPNLLWEADVNRPVRGEYNPTDCFMLDELVASAERSGIRLMLCLLTRDLYMGDLSDEASPEYARAIDDARSLLRYAVARWGYSTSVAAWEYFNEMDPGKPTGRFYRELGEYLAANDPYHHLRTTSAWASAPDDWADPAIDIAQEHFYLRPADRTRVDDEVSAALERARVVRQHAASKPALIGEFGLATDQWGLSDSMKRDANLVHFHNALWASALSGVSGTAMFWWWEQLDQMDAYAHYRPLAAFLAGVPFTTARLQPAEATPSDGRIRFVGLAGDRCLYGWLLNEAATWTRLEADPGPLEPIEGALLTVPGLPAGTYRVQWWDTMAGEVLSEEDVTVGEEGVRLAIPRLSADLAVSVAAR